MSTLKKSDIKSMYRLTPMQHGMLYHYLMDKSSNAYFEQTSFSIEGVLDVNCVEESFNIIITRYDALRTVFVYENVTRPFQIVMKERRLCVHYEDISHLSGEERKIYMEDYKAKDRARGFDLTKDILIRLSVIKTDKSSYKMILSFHHIIMDGWSNAAIIREFVNIYGALTNNRQPQLGRIYPYSDYIKWLEAQDQKEAASYWEAYLYGYEQQALAPGKAGKAAAGEYRLEEMEFKIPRQMTEGLEKLAVNNNTTLSAVVKTIWGILLQRYNNTDDVVFGEVVSGRPHGITGIESMVGLFINTVAVRVKCDGNRSFTGLLKDVRQSALESDRYSYYPFADVQSKTCLKSGLIDHIMIFENYPRDEGVNTLFKGEGTLFDVKGVESFERTNYDFTILIAPGRELYIKFGYNSRVYDGSLIERIKWNLQSAIAWVIDNPDVLVKDIDILTYEEKRQILVDFNNTETEYSKGKTIHQMFEEQVERTPDSIAVVFEDKRLTYRELNEKADRLAYSLKDEQKIHPGSLVGIIMERSQDLLVAMLGILKAGGAYVPIDPEFPIERIKSIIDDAGINVAVSTTSQAGLLAWLQWEFSVFGTQMCICRRSSCVAEEYTYPSGSKDLGPDAAAYAIYTSGSTGKPKGIVIPHRALNNFIEGVSRRIDFSSSKTILSATTISFDIFVLETLLPLTRGLKVVVANEKQQSDPYELGKAITENRVDMFQATPSRIKMILDSGNAGCLEDLSEIMVGGEAVSKALLDGLSRVCKGRIYNMYGPTETTVWSTIQDLTQKDRVDIGKPIANTQVYILDKNSRLSPVGAAGELCIAGDGLAIGYLNNPGLTAEKFVPNPFIPGERMYKTGDLARWLHDGSIEFLGRIDFQVKIRGFRIELGEIEARLLKYELIREAVVVAKEDPQGNKYLCAYVAGEKELQVPELREYLSAELPDYMIPSYFVQLEKLPLTASGKIDRKPLPEPGGNINTGVEYVAPSGMVEERLALLWQEILGAGRIGRNDNFFELGGHSLKATTLVSRIHKEFNAAIPLKEIFKAPTIAEIARYIAGTGESIYQSIQLVERREYYPMSSAQKRLYVLNRLEGAGTAYNMPVAMLVEGAIDGQRFEQAFKHLLNRHETLRTSFHMLDGKPIQRVHDEVEFNVTYLQADEEKAREIAGGFVRPFNLKQAPLLRVGLVKIREERHLLLFDIHHIISDGTSMDILVREFMGIYGGSTLPSLQIQYKDYSVWQRELFAKETITKQEKYWLETFRGEIPVLDMPADYPRPPVQSFEGDHISFKADSELAGKLNRLAKDSGATLYMTLLAAYNVLLAKYTGQEDIIIGSPIAGRHHADLQDIIGMFVNTLAMRNYPQGEKTFIEFLREVKDNALKAYENQDYQFEELVEKLNLKRDMSRNALFDTMLVLQNTGPAGLETAGLRFTPYDNQSGISKFDLALNAHESTEGITFELEYSTRLFKKETSERLAAHYLNVLRGITAYPGKRLSEIDILSQEEKRQILFDFNNTRAEYPKDKTIHRLFEEQAERTPDNTAVVFKDKQLTYRELNERSNRFARVLRSKGVKPDGIVGMMMECSLDMAVAILGILKAGGAYLPIDPGYPAERIKHILEDSGAGLLVTQSHLQTKVKFQGEIVDITSPDTYKADGSNPEKVNSPEDTAYVIYTSGSAGKPKGVEIRHSSLVNFMMWRTGEYRYSEADVSLQLLSVSFDGFATNFYPALLTGGSVVLLEEDNWRDFHHVRTVIKNKKVTNISMVPPMYRALLENARTGDLDTLRFVVLAGDKSDNGLIKLSNAITPGALLINEYGPTENCITTTYHTGIKAGENQIIGKPVANNRVYILGRHNELVPVGAAGELCVSGAGLAKSYLNNPGLTAEKFVQNPFIPGERIYRTGDLARWLPDGNIEFLGRIDFQVKIRGFRIELGEIEAQLLKHAKVTEAVVSAKEGQQGVKYLCAYVAGEKELPVLELRDHLTKELPDYMIPSYFVQLKKLPLTANGKIDRKALPDPDGSINTGVEYIAPSGAVEEKLALLWEDILGAQRIGVNDSFFDMGGHSLKAISLISGIHERFQVQLPMKYIYMTPTIREIARHIQNALANEYIADNGPAIHFNAGKDKTLFAFPPAGGHGLVYADLSRHIDTHGIYSFDFIESEERIEKYMEAITATQPEGPYILFGYSAGGNLAFETAKALLEAGHKVSDIIMLDSGKRLEALPEQEKGLTKNWESIPKEMFGNNQEAIQKALEKIRSYHEYHCSVINSGQVSSNIHLILAEPQDCEGGQPIDLFYGWNQSTSGRFRVYHGHGCHYDVLKEGNIDKNAGIIKEILGAV